MLEKLNKWLSNPKRKYTDGLVIFKALASDKQKANFLQYFDKDADKVQAQFDVKFTMLVSQVAFIQNRVKSSPGAFSKAMTADKTPEKTEDNNHIVDPNKKGNVDTEELPEELKPIRERISEIIPLMAKLHAEMDNEPADDKRLAIIKQLIALDDERREAWAKIDNYEPTEEEEHLADKTFAMGANMHKRVKQLRENIARNKKGLKDKKSKAAKEKAKKKIEEYTEELKELEQIVK